MRSRLRRYLIAGMLALAGIGGSAASDQAPAKGSAEASAAAVEMVHETRVIPPDGRPHVGNGIHQMMGENVNSEDRGR